MQAFLLCDDRTTASQVRMILCREGVDCPEAHVITYADAARKLARAEPELIVAVLPRELSHCALGIDALASLPHGEATRVIAIGPTSDSKMVIRALRGVVDDYMDLDDLEAELVAALVAIRARQPANQEDARLIAVISAGGGCGTSTLASNVATVLAKEHQTAGLIDLRLESGDLASLMNLKPTYTLADLSQNIDRVDRVFFEKALTKHASGVHLLTPPKQLADVPMVTTEGIRQALSLARGMFPYVVVDLGQCSGETPMDVIRQADVVVLVMRLDFTSLMNARRIMEHLEHMGIAPDKLRVVVNRQGQPKEVPASKVEEALGIKIFHFVPDEPKTVNRANNNGVPVVIEAPSSKVSRSVTKLAHSLNGRHKAT